MFAVGVAFGIAGAAEAEALGLEHPYEVDRVGEIAGGRRGALLGRIPSQAKDVLDARRMEGGDLVRDSVARGRHARQVREGAYAKALHERGDRHGVDLGVPGRAVGHGHEGRALKRQSRDRALDGLKGRIGLRRKDLERNCRPSLLQNLFDFHGQSLFNRYGERFIIANFKPFPALHDTLEGTLFVQLKEFRP